MYGGCLLKIPGRLGDCEVKGNCCCMGAVFVCNTRLGLGTVKWRIIAVAWGQFFENTRLVWGTVKSRVIATVVRGLLF